MLIDFLLQHAFYLLGIIYASHLILCRYKNDAPPPTYGELPTIVGFLSSKIFLASIAELVWTVWGLFKPESLLFVGLALVLLGSIITSLNSVDQNLTKAKRWFIFTCRIILISAILYLHFTKNS